MTLTEFAVIGSFILALLTGLARVLNVIHSWPWGRTSIGQFFRHLVSSKWVNILFAFLLGVGISAATILWFPGGSTSCQTSSVTLRYEDFDVRNGVNPDSNLPPKATIYGSMTAFRDVPNGCRYLVVRISIPCNGWGEGLAGPPGSAAEIVVNNQIAKHDIEPTMPYHHGWYYRYEYCSEFSGEFDLAGNNQAKLKINMAGGAHLDFKDAAIAFR